MKATIFYSSGEITYPILNSRAVNFTTFSGLKKSIKNRISQDFQGLISFYGIHKTISVEVYNNGKLIATTKVEI